MARAIILFVIIFLFFAGCSDDDAKGVHTTECITDVSAADNVEFECNSIVFDMSISEECAGGGCGLIFDVHGWTMDATYQNDNTNLAALGRENGYIVVHPNANVEEGTIFTSWEPERDDPFVYDFLTQTIEAFAVDEDRVHFTGFSQGGWMTWRFVCRYPDLFASVAPIAAGSAVCYGEGEDNPAVPVLYCHGTEDKLVEYDSDMGATAAVDAVLSGMGTAFESKILSEDSKHTWTRYTNGEGRIFEFITHDYLSNTTVGGHCFPGTFATEGRSYVLYGCYDEDYAFRWGEAVIDFFVNNPR